MIVYGTPDPDAAAIDFLMAEIQGREVRYIIHHPRVPAEARPCKYPNSLLVQAVMWDNTVVSVRQFVPGGPAKLEKSP